MNKNKKLIIISVLLILASVTIILIGNSFGFFKYLKKGDIVNIITIGGIRTAIVDEENNALQLEDLYPVDDSVGLSQTPFVFKMTNTSNKNFSYSILVKNDEEKMASCKLDDGTACPELSTDYIKYAYKKNDGSYTEPRNLGADSNVITSGIIAKDETITSSIILWIDSEAGNEIQGHYFYGKIIIMGAATTSTNYEEEVLNGAVPVLTDNLVPVKIASNGTVTKANIQEEWYSYKKKNWANAVVLKTNENYENNQVIPEDNIESYFV